MDLHSFIILLYTSQIIMAVERAGSEIGIKEDVRRVLGVNLGRRLVLLGAVAAAGTFFTGCDSLQRVRSIFQPQKAIPPPDQSTNAREGLESFPNPGVDPVQTQKEARNLIARLTDINLAYRWFVPGQQSPEKIHQYAQRLVFTAALFYRQNAVSRLVNVIDEATVVINDQEFDLKQSNDLTYAAALSQTLLRERYGSKDESSFFSKLTMQDVSNILWLRPRFSFEEQQLPIFLEPSEISLFSQVLQSIAGSEKKLTFPKKGRILTGSQAGYDKKDQTLIFNGPPSLSPIHALAQFYIMEYPELFGDDLPIWKNNFRDNFVGFVTEGANFRARILYARDKATPADYQTLRAAYNALRQGLGFETSTKGRVKQMIEAYQTGQLVVIDDDSPEKPGIFLRGLPLYNYQSAPLETSVFNGDRVRIINGSVIDFDDETGLARRLWQVSQAAYWDKPNTWKEQPWFKTGWIPEEYLGAVIIK